MAWDVSRRRLLRCHFADQSDDEWTQTRVDVSPDEKHLTEMDRGAESADHFASHPKWVSCILQKQYSLVQIQLRV